MVCDHYFAKGSQHVVNQDYAQSHAGDDCAVVAIADGCSASEHSDIGARLLVHAALHQLRQWREPGLVQKVTSLGTAAIQQAWQALHALDLQPTALDATLALAWRQASFAAAVIFGDGVIFYRLGAHFHVFEITYSGNAPAYLSYGLETARCALFDQLNQTKSICYTVMAPEGSQTRTFQQPCHQPFVVVPPSAASFLAVASDGMTTFTTASGQPVALRDIVHQWSSFGGLKGAFLQRRLRSFGKQCRRQGVEHADDIACGAVLLERAEELLPPTGDGPVTRPSVGRLSHLGHFASADREVGS